MIEPIEVVKELAQHDYIIKSFMELHERGILTQEEALAHMVVTFAMHQYRPNKDFIDDKVSKIWRVGAKGARGGEHAD